MWNWNERCEIRLRNEHGYVLLEALLSLPMMIFLMTLLGGIFLWMGKTAYIQLADWELENSMTIVMNRLVDDLVRAKQVDWYHGVYDDNLRIYAHADGDPKSAEKFPLVTKLYARKRDGGHHRYRIIYQTASAPLTGSSILGNVYVSDFQCERVAPDILHIICTGTSDRTNHSYTLETSVYLKGE